MRARRRQWREFVANPSIDVPNEVGCEVELEMMRRLAEADWESDRQWMRRVVGEWRWDRDVLQERRRAQAVVNAVEAGAGWRSAGAGPGFDDDGDGSRGEAVADGTDDSAFADDESNADPSGEERDTRPSKRRKIEKDQDKPDLRCKCPIPGCAVMGRRVVFVNAHLRDVHRVPLENTNGGDVAASRARQDAQFREWCVVNGLPADIEREQGVY